MKKQIRFWTLATVLFLAGTFPVMASGTKEGHEGHGHEMSESAEHSAHDMKGAMDHSGNKIHESHVNGYHFTYELIDMRERMKGMKNMPERSATHHLMVYVKDKNGKAVDGGKTGYLITGPGGKQKVMGMGMGGGYGADVKMGEAGKYTIKTKVALGDLKLMDSFEYKVK